MISVFHPSASPCSSTTEVADFDLTQTQFAGTCLTGNGGCPIALPPVRFWRFDGYGLANSGCIDPVAASIMANPSLDFGIGTVPGHWILYQGNWFNSAADGCPLSYPTVVEMSFGHAPAEGTVDHFGWYALAAVGNANDYDFDRVRGGDRSRVAPGCMPGVVRARPVPGLTIEGRSAPSAPCTGSTSVTVGTDNVLDASYFDVEVNLEDTAPEYFTDAGLNDTAMPLIEGIEIVYGAVPGVEPRYSETCVAGSGDWLPVRDPGSPANALAPIPFGACPTRIRVTLPKDAGANHWLAARLVYTDCTVNASRTANLNCPYRRPVPPTPIALLGSAVSGHCGPVAKN